MEVPFIDSKLEIVKSEFNLALTKVGLNYQKLLQSAESIKFTRDTIDQDYEPLKEVRSVIKKIEDVRKEKKLPYKEAGDRIDAAAKSLSAPLVDVLDRKTKEFQKLAEEIKAENAKAEAEKKRKIAIQDAINAYVLNQSTLISQAETDDELVQIEKLINLNLTAQNTKKYQEFAQDFINACNPLRDLIRDQKEKIRRVDQLDKDILNAMQSGNDEAAIELTAKKEETEAEVIHNRSVVQEQAASTIMTNSTNYEVVVPAAPKPRQTRWSYELVDVDAALKHNRDMLDISVNAKKAAVKLDEVKAGGKEQTIGGVRYYLKEIY